MDIKYVVSVKQVVDTSGPGEEPKITETVMADFTGGPNAASAVLASLAESVQKGKKVVGLAAFLKTVNESIDKHNKEAKEKGEPTLSEALKAVFDSKPGSTKR